MISNLSLTKYIWFVMAHKSMKKFVMRKDWESWTLQMFNVLLPLSLNVRQALNFSTIICP